MRKRIVCLLLLLPTLLVSTLAINSGNGVYQGSSATSSGNFASGLATGLALGIQVMDGDDYVVYPEDQKPEDWIDGAEVNNKGLANVAEHFLYSYPNPIKGKSEFSTVYILPKEYNEPKYLTSTVGGTWDLVDIGDHYYAYEHEWGASDRPIYRKWDTSDKSVVSQLYADAIAGNIKDASYFDGYIDGMNHDTARDLIGYIFARYKSTWESGLNRNAYTVNVDEVNYYWNQVYKYNVGSHGSEKENTVQTVCNYATILLSLARILPEENRDAYTTVIAQFVVGALNGKEYKPVVITAEMCLDYRYSSSNKKFDAWMTVPEMHALWTGVAEDEFRNAQVGVLQVNALGSKDKNMAQTLLKTALTKNNRNASKNAYGVKSMLGLYTDGSIAPASSGIGSYCRAMTSLSKSAISAYANTGKGRASLSPAMPPRKPCGGAAYSAEPKPSPWHKGDSNRIKNSKSEYDRGIVPTVVFAFSLCRCVMLFLTEKRLKAATDFFLDRLRGGFEGGGGGAG